MRREKWQQPGRGRGRLKRCKKSFLKEEDLQGWGMKRVVEDVVVMDTTGELAGHRLFEILEDFYFELSITMSCVF